MMEKGFNAEQVMGKLGEAEVLVSQGGNEYIESFNGKLRNELHDVL